MPRIAITFDSGLPEAGAAVRDLHRRQAAEELMNYIPAFRESATLSELRLLIDILETWENLKAASARDALYGAFAAHLPLSTNVGNAA
jgi:hypothetical protein